MKNTLSLIFVYIFLFSSPSIFCQQTTINPQDITIVRDKWGVPHIYGKTDADAAYGLAWAHAEDDFEGIQHAILAIRGRLGERLGVEGATLDVVSYMVNTDYTIDQYFDTAFSPEFRKVLAASAQGFNDYAAAHPEEVFFKNTFPMTEKEIIKGYILGQAVLSNAAFGLGRVLDGKLERYRMGITNTGSNAFAFSKKKTKEGETFLVSNTHQPLEGTLSWYEAHVNSEEGWNMLGGKFSTGVSIFVGTNENLGWTHTTNYPDLHDVYALEMHPSDKLKYKYDEEWKRLEKRKFKFKVKIGFIKVPVSRTFYWSEYGPTLKNKEGFFAVRFPAGLNIRAAEQWFWMNKASNFEEFKEALSMQALSCQNIMYADKEDNIFFISNGQFPKRDPNLNWKGILDGSTSTTKWKAHDYHPLSALPQIENPDCGYLFNANNTPFTATCEAENLNPKNYDPTMGFLQFETNRSLRIIELLNKYDKLSYQDLKEVKYDLQYATETFYTHTLSNLDSIFNLDTNKYPDLKDAMEIGQKWNGATDIHNKQATLFSVAITKVLTYLADELIFDMTNTIPEDVYVDALRWAKKYLKKHYGTLEIELGEFQKHARADVEFPIGGMPENLAAMFMQKYKKGKMRSYTGDSYIQFARFTDEGVKIESVHPYGASNRKGSPHYTDQMSLYANQQLKPMTLDKATIFKNAERVYHPGE